MKAPPCQAIAFPVDPFVFARGTASKLQHRDAVGASEKPQLMPWCTHWH